MDTSRWSAWLAGLWGGALLGIGLIGAPAGFATTLPELAGRIAGRMFTQEAYLSLALAIVLFLMLRAQARRAAQAGGGSVLNGNMLLVLGTLFCTVAGYFALQPMMAAARAGQGAWSFGALHGMSMGFYALKALLVLVLAWRLGGR
ncbi:MAG TPA: DUF4149 domain-containing protein [Albitalea sp.]